MWFRDLYSSAHSGGRQCLRASSRKPTLLRQLAVDERKELQVMAIEAHMLWAILGATQSYFTTLGFAQLVAPNRCGVVLKLTLKVSWCVPRVRRVVKTRRGLQASTKILYHQHCMTCDKFSAAEATTSGSSWLSSGPSVKKALLRTVPSFAHVRLSLIEWEYSTLRRFRGC